MANAGHDEHVPLPGNGLFIPSGQASHVFVATINSKLAAQVQSFLEQTAFGGQLKQA
jgi:hypothetical protein